MDKYPGNLSKTFNYIDFISLRSKKLTKDCKIYKFNLASGKNYAEPEIIKLFEELTGKKVNIVSRSPRTDHNYSSADVYDNAIVLNFKSQFDIEYSILEYYHWYMKYHHSHENIV